MERRPTKHPSLQDSLRPSAYRPPRQRASTTHRIDQNDDQEPEWYSFTISRNTFYMASAFVILLILTCLIYFSIIPKRDAPLTPATLLMKNINTTHGLISAGIDVETSLEERPESRTTYTRYRTALLRIREECNEAITLADRSKEFTQISEGVRSHNERSKAICEELQNKFLNYAFDSLHATGPLLNLRTEPRRRYEILYRPPTADKIQVITNDTLKNYRKVNNSSEYEGHEEILILLESVNKVALESKDPEIVKAKLKDTQTNLFNQHVYYWQIFVRLSALRTALENQLKAYCEDAASMQIRTSNCES